MKIFILADINSTHTQRWVKALAQYPCQIFLFGLLQCDDSCYRSLQNVTVYSFNLTLSPSSILHPWLLHKVQYFKAVKVIKQKVAEFQPDLVHAHYASSYGLLGALAGKHPYLISVWGSDVYSYPQAGWLYKKLLTYSLKKADVILSTSHCMARETARYTSKEIAITPFGVDTTRFKQMERPASSKLVIGTIKTLSANYGIDILIRTFALVCQNNPDKDLLLRIVGDGPDKAKLQALCAELKISDRVEFAGFIANEQLPEVYNSIDIFVALSHKESFGVVAVEAMACETPVVVSEAEGFREVVVHGETGWIVPHNDPSATADAIQTLIDQPEQRIAMGQKGRQQVLTHYDWKQNVETMYNIYQKMVANKR